MQNNTSYIPCDPPEHLLSDYGEMMFLGLCIAVGTPLNLYVLTKLIRQYKHVGGGWVSRNGVKAGFILLKINVNITDLVILDVYCLGRLGWLSTYEWAGGDLMCKLYQFSVFVALYASSNIVVCIAVDRLRNVLTAHSVRLNAVREVKVISAIAWVTAILWSAPQLMIWESRNVIQCVPNGFHQCVTRLEPNSTEMTVYNLVHLLSVFWIPLICMAICYGIIAVRLVQYSISQPTGTSIRKPRNAVSMHCNDLAIDHSVDDPTIVMTKTGTNGTISIQSGQVPSSLIGVNRTHQATCPHHPLHNRNHEIQLAQRTQSQMSENQMSDTATPDDRLLDQTIDDSPPPRYSDIRKTDICELCQRPTRHRDKNIVQAKLRKISSRFHSRKDSGTCRRNGAMDTGPRAQSCKLPERVKKSRRESHDTGIDTLTTHSQPQGATVTVKPMKQSAWRRQLRSKVFRTTLLIVLTHVLLWLPYQTFSAIYYIAPSWHVFFNNYLNFFKPLQILITLVNPFLYGFAFA